MEYFCDSCRRKIKRKVRILGAFKGYYLTLHTPVEGSSKPTYLEGRLCNSCIHEICERIKSRTGNSNSLRRSAAQDGTCACCRKESNTENGGVLKF